MARIRYIKPEFFEDTKISEASIHARLLYIGLWCWMDRQGVVEDEPKIIKKNIFPYEDDIAVKKVIGLVDELVGLGILKRVSHNDRNFLYCPKFKLHQKFHPGEECKHKIPEDILNTTYKQPASNLQASVLPPANNALTLTLTGTLTGTSREASAKPSPNVAKFISAYVKAFGEKFDGQRPNLKDGRLLGQIRNYVKSQLDIDRACNLIQVYFQLEEKWFETKQWDFTTFVNNQEKVALAFDTGREIKKQSGIDEFISSHKKEQKGIA